MRKAIVLILLALSICSQTALAQRLGDTSFRKMSRVDMADYFTRKSRSQKAGGYAMLSGGFLMVVAGTALAVDDLWGSTSNDGAAVFLVFAGAGSMAASYPVLSAGARNKGKAEMLYLNPGYRESRDLLEHYKRKAKANSITAWSLLGGGIVLPIILRSGSNYSETANTIASITSLGVFVSIPFFMEAAKNKGRVSILMGTEYVPSSYLNGSGRQTSIGIGFPL